MDLNALERDLQARGEPFVRATVVWRRAPSSGQVGSKAVVTPDGHVRGWVGGSGAEHPDVEVVFTSLDLRAAGVGERSLVVVATQGHYDEDALEHVLSTPAAYVGLVASGKRAEAVLAFLRDRGVAEEQLARVHAPAGMELGHVAPPRRGLAGLAALGRVRPDREIAADGRPGEVPRRHAGGGRRPRWPAARRAAGGGPTGEALPIARRRARGGAEEEALARRPAEGRVARSIRRSRRGQRRFAAACRAR